MKKRFSDEQIISILRKAEAGVSERRLCRKHAISDATFYTLRKKFSGMEVPEVKRLKSLKEESGRLRKLLAGRSVPFNLPLFGTVPGCGRTAITTHYRAGT